MVRCIKRYLAAASWVDEWARAGAGDGLVMRWSWVRIPFGYSSFFFFFPLEKFSKFFGGLIAGTRSAKFPVPVPVR